METVKERRKKQRIRKKVLYRFSESRVESLTLESLKTRWRERCGKYEIEFKKELEEKERLRNKMEMRLEHLRKQKEDIRALVSEEVSMNEEIYADISTATTDQNATSPLLYT